MELAEREGIFTGGSGVKLHYRGHRIESAPFRAVVALIEAPEDKGRLYADLVQQLTPSGYVLYGCAHHEHRRVPGQTGFLEEWNEFYQELDAFLGLVRMQEPDAPLFLAGGHVAGQLVLTYALHHPEGLRGVIGFQPRLHASTFRSSIVSFTRALSRVWPAFTPTSEVDPAITPDVAARKPTASETRSENLSSDLAVTDATASDIVIPVLIIDGEMPAASGANSVNSKSVEMSQNSVKDVELWLDRVLRGGAE
jgi:alpha-beta hydrolase superfamily lysophospholipase